MKNSATPQLNILECADFVRILTDGLVFLDYPIRFIVTGNGWFFSRFQVLSLDICCVLLFGTMIAFYAGRN